MMTYAPVAAPGPSSGVGPSAGLPSAKNSSSGLSGNAGSGGAPSSSSSFGLRSAAGGACAAHSKGGAGGGGSAWDDGNVAFTPLKIGIDRQAVDLSSSVVRYFTDTVYERSVKDRSGFGFLAACGRDVLPLFACGSGLVRQLPGVCNFLAYSSVNKSRAPCSTLKWFPDGRKILSGTQVGELAIWNGRNFTFEDIKRLPLGGGAVTALVWSPSEEHLYTGDTLGHVITLTPALSHIHDTAFSELYQHAIVDLSVSPTGHKLCGCADGAKPVVWDVTSFQLERFFEARNVDTLNTSCLQWHPHKSLVATGSRTHWLYLWDPRQGMPVGNIQAHKHSVTGLRWSSDGVSLATCSRDTLVKIWDLRTLTATHCFRCPAPIVPKRGDTVSPGDMEVLVQAAEGRLVPAICKGSLPEPTCCSWSPADPRLLATGDTHGNLCYWSTLMPPTNAVPSAPIAVSPGVPMVDTSTSSQPSSTPASASTSASSSAASSSAAQAFPQTATTSDKLPLRRPLSRIVHSHGGVEAWGGVVSGLEGGTVQAVLGMDWHPMGHLLATAGEDRLMRFWCRSPQGFVASDVLDAYSLVRQHVSGAFPVARHQTLQQCKLLAETAARSLEQPDK